MQGEDAVQPVEHEPHPVRNQLSDLGRVRWPPAGCQQRPSKTAEAFPKGHSVERVNRPAKQIGQHARMDDHFPHHTFPRRPNASQYTAAPTAMNPSPTSACPHFSTNMLTSTAAMANTYRAGTTG